LPETLKPLSDNVSTIVQKDSASKMVNDMKQIIADEGILDYEKDIIPAIDQWMEANPKATQAEIFRHFETINHKLSLERMKLGKRKVNRDESKGNLRSNREGVKIDPSKVNKTGNFDKDADALLDAMGIS